MLHTANLKVGHATDPDHHTGCTVFLCPDETVAGVDVRGMAPGSRELTLLDPIKSVPHVHAILLTGGSAFGLSAADGVMGWLAEHDIGHWTPIRRVPIVPTAVVYDLFINGGQHPPGSDFGYAACKAAHANEPLAQGCVGAGAGVTVGKWAGIQHCMKSGFGAASLTIDGVEIFAAAVVNAVGDVVTENGEVLAGSRNPDGGWMVAQDPLRRFPAAPPAALTNTTLVCIATTAKLNKVEANRLAQRGHDGLAIAIHPVHTMHDGDTVFALSTGEHALPFDTLANGAVTAVTQAIRNAVRTATTTNGIPGLADS